MNDKPGTYERPKPSTPPPISRQGFNPNTLTKHERHARLVKIVRRRYQEENPGSRIFPNNSGIAWQGNANNHAGMVELYQPRPIRFGIPEPSGDGEKSGGTDLLGETILRFKNIVEIKYPILTGVEIKTGKSRLKKNQKVFRDWLKSVNGIWYLARECDCWKSWTPVWAKSKIVDWLIPACDICDGKGYILEDN